MSTDIISKIGDTRIWLITISDASGSALNLASSRVQFQLRWDEGASDTYFVRDTSGTGSDNIAINSPASDGVVAITPTTADWTGISDNFGIYVGEFKVTDSGGTVQYTTDMQVEIQQTLV